MSQAAVSSSTPLSPVSPEDEPGARAIDLQDRPVAEILSDVLHSRPQAPTPPALPPALPAARRASRRAVALLMALGGALFLLVFLLSGRLVWWLGEQNWRPCFTSPAAKIGYFVAAPLIVVFTLVVAAGLSATRPWAPALLRAMLAVGLSYGGLGVLSMAPEGFTAPAILAGSLAIGGMFVWLLGRPSLRAACAGSPPPGAWTDRLSLSSLVLLLVSLLAALRCGVSLGQPFPAWGTPLEGETATWWWTGLTLWFILTAGLLTRAKSLGWWMALAGLTALASAHLMTGPVVSWPWAAAYGLSLGWLFGAVRSRVKSSGGLV